MASMRRRVFAAIITIAFLAGATGVAQRVYSDRHEAGEIAFLIPDAISPQDPRVQVWLDAAAEEGIRLEVMRDNEFLRPWQSRSRFVGAILPDQIHREASDVLIQTLRAYVRQGGKLMLTYDAGSLRPDGAFAPARSRFSSLAGVDYILYHELHNSVTVWKPVLGTVEDLNALNVPPGKYIDATDIDGLHVAGSLQEAERVFTVSGYEYPYLSYPSFATRGEYSGRTLLATPDGGVVAGYRHDGRGAVLFVNLPLGYLKGQTDGLFLHGFLRYFADRVTAVPTLGTVPDGVGGVVMNWHVDSNVSFVPLKKLGDLGFYKQGPYSVHITAGPDARTFGDGLGFNVPKNPAARKWIRFFRQHGYTVGSHGGWIHDYFGHKVDESNRASFEKYLVLNKKALEGAYGLPIREYSAPEGNHPKWVDDWLEKNGFLAYYFTGNAGMGPTRSYRDGVLRQRHLWSFPIMTYHDMASFQETREGGVTEKQLGDWLVGVDRFCEKKHVVRLVYFHPRDALLYPSAMRAWLRDAARAQKARNFRWYTMTQIARFLNRREEVKWHATDEAGGQVYVATHPQSLAHMAWTFPATAYDRPVILAGSGTVAKEGDRYLVIAGVGRQLSFRAQRKVQ